MQNFTLTTTSSQSFFLCSGGDETLFDVRPGVDAFAAIEMVSCLLDVARTCAFEGTEHANFSNAAAYLTDMAKAVVDSVVRGSTAKPDESKLANVFERLNVLHRNGVLTINAEAGKLERDDAQGFLDWACQQAKGGDQ